MHVAFVIASLAAGGAERVASSLANYWSSVGDEVTMATLDFEKTDFYSLSPLVERVALGLGEVSSNPFRRITKNFRRVRQLRRVIRQSRPDVIVSFLAHTNVVALAAALGSGVPVVVSERSNPIQSPVGRAVDLLRHVLYPRAHALVVQTEAVAEWARRVVKAASVWVIPNPVHPPTTQLHSFQEQRSLTVLAMGRLVPVKGFDVLLQAFAWCARSHHDWTLRIVGDGPERGRLEALADKLGITTRVRLDPFLKEPEAAFKSAGLFALSSRYEGFPNVLLEAMASGLPVISFDCPNGPKEIIRDGLDGVLVPANNVEVLAEGMDRLMGAEDERKRLAASAIQVAERFSLTKVATMWQEVLDEAVREPHGLMIADRN
jgi:GalNAc-alpha-(1->4)-GalNAc-alpha-(1->3)-diNAcBac-PP-undecaprenol alpha-1,4-N-acetyl-D-galactosaminyltransferase